MNDIAAFACFCVSSCLLLVLSSPLIGACVGVVVECCCPVAFVDVEIDDAVAATWVSACSVAAVELDDAVAA